MKMLMSILLVFTSCGTLAARPENEIQFGGFLDLYYTYDFLQPEKRAYTTQALKHRDVNINLGYLEAVLDNEDFTGRVALQAGDSIYPNYAAEADKNIKYLQEAFLRYRIFDKTWITAGVFFSHLGMESWISKNNRSYTRSLISEYSPYYSSGLKVDHTFNDKQSLQVLLLNGWSNVTEGGQGLALGFQYTHIFTTELKFIYGNFFGNEKISENQKGRFRTFHNLNLVYDYSEKWKFMGSFDIGEQSQQKKDGIDVWFGSSLQARRELSEIDAMTYRLEYYNDSHQSNVETGTPDGFRVIGASVNYDRELHTNLLWRTELKGYHSQNKIFPKQDNDLAKVDGFIVTSLSLSF